MHTMVIGANHNNAPVEIREKVAFTEVQKIDAVNDILDLGMNEVIILSTCNRSEIYLVCSNIEEAVQKMEEFYKEFFKEEDICKYLFVKYDDEAIRHIYNVAAGLDSIIIGEDQILGQVKDALEFAMEIGSSKKVLNKLFREAITVSKNIKDTLAISEIPLSTSYIAIKKIKEKLHSLENKNVLLIGAGKMSILALKYFEEEKIGYVYICNRTFEKVKDICDTCPNLNIIPIEYNDRYKVFDKVDIVFTATKAPHLVIRNSGFSEIKKPMYIVDLAVPRDVDIEVLNRPMVTLYDIDDLKRLSNDNLKKREELSIKAMDIIEDSIEEFSEWCLTIKFDPVIKSLNDRCDEIQGDTLDYIYRKIDLDKREKRVIEKMVRSSLKRLVREPIKNLKEFKDGNTCDEYVDMINKLFNF